MRGARTTCASSFIRLSSAATASSVCSQSSADFPGSSSAASASPASNLAFSASSRAISSSALSISRLTALRASSAALCPRVPPPRLAHHQGSISGRPGRRARLETHLAGGRDRGLGTVTRLPRFVVGSDE
jgi:hypothetical protein